MKTKSIFFLLLFSSFLIAPAVISMCNMEQEISYFFSMGEEEKADTSVVDSEKQTHTATSLPENFQDLDGRLLHLGTVSFWDKLFPDTTSPPPELFTV